MNLWHPQSRLHLQLFIRGLSPKALRPTQPVPQVAASLRRMEGAGPAEAELRKYEKQVSTMQAL